MGEDIVGVGTLWQNKRPPREEKSEVNGNEGELKQSNSSEESPEEVLGPLQVSDGRQKEAPKEDQRDTIKPQTAGDFHHQSGVEVGARQEEPQDDSSDQGDEAQNRTHHGHRQYVFPDFLTCHLFWSLVEY